MPTKTTTEPTNGTPAAGPEDEEVSYEEYEQRRLDLIAKLPPKSDRPKYLIDKLALVTGLVGEIKKTGRNTFHNYRYAKESDLVEAIRPLLAELGIRIHQSLYGDLESGFIPHQRLGQMKRDATSTVDTLTAITMVFWFEHVVDGKVEKTDEQIFMGYGDDPGDKGVYKAFTGCEKYFLMKTFLVSTGDDPEGDTRADQRASERSAPPRAARSERQGGTAQPKHGGRQQEASSPQIRQLGELLRETGLARSSAKTLKYFEETLGRPFPVVDGDPAKTLQAALEGDIKPDEMGKLIASLRVAEGTAQAVAEALQDKADDDEQNAILAAEQEPQPDDDEDAGPAV